MSRTENQSHPHGDPLSPGLRAQGDAAGKFWTEYYQKARVAQLNPSKPLIVWNTALEIWESPSGKLLGTREERIVMEQAVTDAENIVHTSNLLESLATAWEDEA